METPEEFVGSNDQFHLAMASVKGRRFRTKRRRVNSSTTAGGCGGGGGVAVSSTSSSGGGDEDFASSSSSQTVVSGEICSTEEEEDMANCLILLAQGGGRRRGVVEESGKMERINGRRFSDMGVVAVTATQSKGAGFYVYECKTCNRTFPSFQALGGHRASHKKPKPTTVPAAVSTVDEKIKKLPIIVSRDESEESEFNKILPVQINNRPAANSPGNNKTKVHECSICGLEFTSGQALGGHMRRHRAVATAAVVSSSQVSGMNMDPTSRSRSSNMETEMKQRNLLQLDLNLPAPEEDLRETKFQFTATPQTIVFSAPTLVDCHY